MDGLRSAWRRGGEFVFGDTNKLPERDEHMAVADSLMSELDFHVKELSRIFQQRERDEKRSKTGVDYTWLIAVPPKVYEIPQLERLELEELCLKVLSYQSFFDLSDASRCTATSTPPNLTPTPSPPPPEFFHIKLNLLYIVNQNFTCG